MRMRVRVRACVCACVRACVCVCVSKLSQSGYVKLWMNSAISSNFTGIHLALVTVKHSSINFKKKH